MVTNVHALPEVVVNGFTVGVRGQRSFAAGHGALDGAGRLHFERDARRLCDARAAVHLGPVR